MDTAQAISHGCRADVLDLGGLRVQIQEETLKKKI
jgi:hypothetical protein